MPAAAPEATGSWQASGGGTKSGGWVQSGDAAWANMPPPSDNLYVCGLPMDCSEDSVKSIFSQYGMVVSVKVLPVNGKPDRACLVRMGDTAQAQWLVENVNQNIPVGLTSPIVVRFAQRAATKIPTGNTQTGTVKVWLEERGMGFIVPTAGGADHFVHRSDLADGHSLVQGGTITFDPGWDVQKNKPVAKKVTGAIPAPVDQWATPDAGKGKGKSKGPGVMPTAPVPPSAPASGMKDGFVKVWFEEKGYGFLTPNDGNGDTFVHRTAVQDADTLVQGAPVTFLAEWDTTKNRSIAKSCIAKVIGNAGTKLDMAAMKGGTVKIWFEEKGYGFLSADDGSGDIFCHRSSLVDGLTLVQGAPVRFEAQWNQAKGKSIATKVAGAAGASQSPMALPAAAGGEAQASHEVLITGLPATSTEESVRAVFGPYGTILECTVQPDGAQGQAATLRMADIAQATWLCRNLDGNMPVGLDSPIHVVFANSATSAGYGKVATETWADSRVSPY